MRLFDDHSAVKAVGRAGSGHQRGRTPIQMLIPIPKDAPMLKLLLIIALIVVVVMFVVPALRRRSGRGL